MRRSQRSRSSLAFRVTLAAALAAVSLAATAANASETNARKRAAHKNHSGVAYAKQSRSTGYVDLSEDGASGAGFYPLPRQYRTGALHERQNRPIEYAGERNPIGFAIQSEAIGYDYDSGVPFGGGYAFSNSHSVLDPIDGVGTPFFGGYYNN
ncbi:hypothetical protein Msil_1752 [Methylocella silvestris BL2]|uniref:Uncharacterized protein n=1 Tax=Methylocella silvestris (strain DSM 15510 / CIP 108128 / LMG 27833 / NCIMB 13906 / BL2) TaxID=395965 RepID=B8ELR7_METSB|nr:hypothetical protein Msil_1752 [Methylocella silvestris BL2]